MQTKRQDITRQLVIIATFIFTLVFNSLANVLPLNDRTTGEISDALPSFFTPAGFTFAVWTVIYLALIGFVAYQALPGQRDNIYARRIGYLPAVANLLNGVWIAAWHYGFYWLSVAIMTALLVSLLAIYIRLNVGLPTAEGGTRSWRDNLFIYLPFSLYFAWINVALVANVASVANNAGWNGWGLAEPTWAVVMIGVVAVAAVALLVNRANLPYAAVLIWALFGIQANQPEPVATAAVVTAVVIGVAAVVGWYRFWQETSSSGSAATGMA